MSTLVGIDVGGTNLRIGVVQGGRVTEERIVKQRGHVTVGPSERNTFVIANASIEYGPLLGGRSTFMRTTVSKRGASSTRSMIRSSRAA